MFLCLILESSGNLTLVTGCFIHCNCFNSRGQDITEDGGIGLIGTFSKGICLLFNKWFAEMANDAFFFSD